MPRALTAAQRAQRLSEQKEHAYKEAVAIYKAEHSQSFDSTQKRPRSLRDIVGQFGSIVNLATLSRRVKDLPSAKEVGRSRTKLKAEEETVLIKQLIFMSSRGFPYSQRMVREEATKILRARCERECTKYVPLGKRWPTAFMLRHSDQLQMYWSTSKSRLFEATSVTAHQYFPKTSQISTKRAGFLPYARRIE